MNLKIFVTKASDTTFSQQLDFNKFPITLGRDEKNDIILLDPFKVISRRHANIVDTEGILQIIDLGSQNFTFLNENRIEPNEENTLQSGDIIKIGEYEIEVLIIIDKEIVPDDDQKTMVFSAPFSDELNAISDNLKLIAIKYSEDISPRKAEMLRFSILQNFNLLEKNEVNKILAEFFSENFLEQQKNKQLSRQEYKVDIKIQEPQIKQSQTPDKDNLSKFSQEYSFSSHFSGVTDVLLDAFSKLLAGFLQFRQEFFGVTIYHIIPIGSLNELKEYLFGPAITSEEEKKRLGLLKEETEKLLAHQVGLLEGYRLSITEGSKTLLQSLNPDVIEKELLAKTPTQVIDIGKLLPFTQKTKILEILKENYQKYISDTYHVEKKYFRPPFMKGYQKRILSNQKSENEY